MTPMTIVKARSTSQAKVKKMITRNQDEEMRRKLDHSLGRMAVRQSPHSSLVSLARVLHMASL